MGSMVRLVFFLWLWISLGGIAMSRDSTSVKPLIFYVAQNGNDAWSGKLATPNRAKTDGPFATIARAQEAIRELKAKEGLKQPIVVYIRKGTYYLSQSLVFTPEDSGTEECPIVYSAYPKEKVVISGGVPLKGWKRDGKGNWVLEIGEVKQGKWRFAQLFVNGERRYRPRLPKEGYYHIAQEVPPSEKAEGKGYDRFGFSPGEIKKEWENSDVEVLVFHYWSTSRLPIASVDEEKKIVTFAGHTSALAGWHGLQAGRRYIVDNVKEALSQPGEWYLDVKSGRLTYIPKRGEDPAKAEVIAPRLEKLLEIKGDAGNHRWVEHLTFRNLTFAHSNWTMPSQGYSWPQAESILWGAISWEGARYCSLEGCRIEHIGTYGVELGKGCKYNRVEDCEIVDLGAGGVKIGEMGIQRDEEAVASHNIIRNCLIAYGGRLHPAGVGVWIGQSHHNTIEHNEIFDFYYTGISIGWTWGYGESLANHNLVQYNHIYKIGQGVLSDMGGIYTLGISPGTILRYNLIHNVRCAKDGYGGWGIYFDEGSTHILAENNIVYDTMMGGLRQHYGRENRVENNIFAFDSISQICRFRPEPHTSFIFQRNIVYWEEGQLLEGADMDKNCQFDYNLYWNPKLKREDYRFLGKTFEEWKATGQDIHSLIADPLFVDPHRRNFALRPDSPALSLGFKPISQDKIGRLPPSPKTITPPCAPAFPPVE